MKYFWISFQTLRSDHLASHFPSCSRGCPVNREIAATVSLGHCLALGILVTTQFFQAT